MRRRGKLVVRLLRVLVGVLLMLVLLSIGLAEGTYRYWLHKIGELPSPPSSELSPRVLAAVWAAESSSPRMEVERIDLIALKVGRVFLLSEEPVKAGQRIASAVAKSWIDPQQGSRLDWHFKNLALMIWLTRNWSAEQLAGYRATRGYFGPGVYGIDAAGRLYFGVGSSGLDLGQAALLAGLLQAPSRNDPARHLERATMRRNFVLDRLLAGGFITSEEHEQARRTPVTLVLAPGGPDLHERKPNATGRSR